MLEKITNLNIFGNINLQLDAHQSDPPPQLS
jgi:hypothetical protein